MRTFETAQAFFLALEEPRGWEGCKQYVEPAATFVAQSEPISDITTVEDYCEWLKAFGTKTAAGATYELHSSSYDGDARIAMFFGTYIASHVGEGGPVPPTNKSTRTHYVYVITMSADRKVSKMVKIWNAPWAMRELGWIQ